MFATMRCSRELVGQTLVILAVSGTYQKLAMLATVTDPGKLRWMTVAN